MKRTALISAGIALVLYAAPAPAHHSFAMFDIDKTVELKGAVKDFQWTNPHSWLQVLVVGPKGTQEEWALEMGSPGTLARTGWRPHIVKPGDNVSIKMHPLKDGAHGGQLLAATLSDGKVLGVTQGGGQ